MNYIRNTATLLAAASSMAAAVQLQDINAQPQWPKDPANDDVFRNGDVIIDECGKSHYHSKGEYEIHLACDGHLTLKKHGVNGQNVLAVDMWKVKLDHHPWHYEGVGFTPGKLVMQGDGNLVVYDDSSTEEPMWSTGTAGRVPDGEAWLSFQEDGNLVIYAGNESLWDSGTDVPRQSYNIPILWNTFGNDQDRRQIHESTDIYYFINRDHYGAKHNRGKSNSYPGNGGPIDKELALQDDGNVVLYRHLKPAYWNIVECLREPAALWDTGTHGQGGKKILWLTTDGKLKLEREGGEIIWESPIGDNGAGQGPYWFDFGYNGDKKDRRVRESGKNSFLNIRDRNDKLIWAADQTVSACRKQTDRSFYKSPDMISLKKDCACGDADQYGRIHDEDGFIWQQRIKDYDHLESKFTIDYLYKDQEYLYYDCYQ